MFKATYRIIILLLLLSLSSVAQAADFTNSVVKIFVTSNRMNYYQPWQSHGISGGAGSGSIIEGNRILTNAHVVADHTFIQVKKNNNPKKYTARLEAIGHDCDLAILTVEDPSFFDGTKPITLGKLPELQDQVTVLGYPQGGEKISITKGVVSRVELSSYSISARKLLAVQIDAAINPGNSGGPVIQNGKMVGVAMQIYHTGQNIGYMIPPPIVQHFFDDLKDGKYDGFPLIGINYNNTENKTLRKFYNIDEQQGGVVISKIIPFAPAYGILKENDVVLSIDGVPIGVDGTYSFRGNERLAMPHLVTKKQIGDTVDLKVMRDGNLQDLSIKLKPYSSLVPHPYHFKKPPYYILGGLVFTVVSTDFLQSWGKAWYEKAPLNMNYYLIGAGRLNPKLKRGVIVLLSVLPDDINVGYHGYKNEIIHKVNGQEFKSFEEFVTLMDQTKRDEKYSIIETEQGARIILDNANIDNIDTKILKRNNIPRRYSEDVSVWLEN